MKPLLPYQTACLIASIVSCSSSCNASTNSTAVSSTSGGTVEITFTGNNSVHQVNGDRLEAKGGVLKLNGVDYGAIDDKSHVRYSVRGDKKTLYVDGVVREPAR